MSCAWLCLSPLPLALVMTSTNTIDALEVLAQAPAVQPSDGDSAPGTHPMTREKGVNAIRVISLTLLAIVLLFLMVLLGSFILARSARRHQAALAHQKRPPTPADDVWVQHKLPENFEDFLDSPSDES